MLDVSSLGFGGENKCFSNSTHAAKMGMQKCENGTPPEFGRIFKAAMHEWLDQRKDSLGHKLHTWILDIVSLPKFTPHILDPISYHGTSEAISFYP